MPKHEQLQMSTDDKILVARLRENDRKAFDTLFHAYYAKVSHLAYRFLHSQEDAEEIAQQTFIAIWENRYKLTGKNLSLLIFNL
ncbi:MAG: hypothetical protein HC905_19170 [Bacteroidales bacterium]|nr:hypothetical protein [Bacteroidales bacterium]